MPVSFYTQVSIIALALLLLVTQFLGFPYPLLRGVTIFFAFVLIVLSTHALYRGYLFVLVREERRSTKLKEQHNMRQGEGVSNDLKNE